MASILRNFFTSKSSTGTYDTRIQGHSYDSAIALDPPVKGSYPVAGNGPNVLEEVQRSRAHRESSGTRRPSGGVAPSPNVPRFREDVSPRPQTAPDGGPGYNKRGSMSGSMSWVGRTRSGFSSKSPPSIFRSSSQHSRRNNSMRSNIEHPLPPLPAQYNTSTPEVYQPKKGPGPGTEVPGVFTPPFAQHLRTGSNASQNSYVDLLDAQSSIRPESSRHRAQASGVRNYGEDVADRNISRSRPPKPDAAQLDLNSPQFSYMKTVYAPKKQPAADVAGGASKARPEPHPRVSSALGHVLGETDGPSDDVPPRSYGKSPSIRSATITSRSHPLRAETASRSNIVSYSTASRGRVRDEDQPSSSSSDIPPSQEQGARDLSPLPDSNTAQSKNDQSIMRETLRKFLRPKQKVNQTREQPETRTQTFGEKFLHEPPSVAATIPRAPPAPQKDDSLATPTSNSSANHAGNRKAALSVSNQSPLQSPVSIKSSKSGHRQSKTGSVSYLPFPNTSNRPGNNNQTDRTDFAARSPSIRETDKRQGMILEDSSVPPNLDGIVDLTNTVDTEVITKQLPAVTHEHVTPVRREIREERIMREIHTHEVRHHILPVIEIEILPAKHYIHSPDGKGLIEIPESQVPDHKLTGRMNGNWSLSRTPQSCASSLTQKPAYHNANLDYYEAAEAPVIGLARGEPPKPRSRANSRNLKNLFTEPILISKKEYMTEQNFPRTEYVWRHPPVYEDAIGRTQPVVIGAGLGYSARDQFLEDGARAFEKSTVRSHTEEYLFRDSGYGSYGLLPGLSSVAPTSNKMYKNGAFEGTAASHAALDGGVSNFKIRANAEREARRGHNMNGMSRDHVQEGYLVNGMNGMHV